MIPLVVGLAVLVGLSLGLLGGGGSILTVPVLVYVADMGPREAITTSLLVVGVTSAVAVLTHARAGRVQWRTALVFAGAGLTGAYAGGRLAAFVPEDLLLVGFAVMMVATAAAMVRGRKESMTVHRERLPVGWIVVQGVAVGLVTGLIGAGGGFLVVPALVLLGGLPMHAAVGTSLVVISAQSFAGLAGHLADAHIDWAMAGGVTAAAVAGSLIGGRLVGRVDATKLRAAFGWMTLVIGLLMLTQLSTT